ncbi:glycosyltransferase family 2 protein [Sphingobacterium sp. Lzh-3]|uniref:glycosyltransferase family 2 protein n=1 Tax=Sphingobacterium sp. Lzh-3 TaxID=3382150 RepID=UPI00398CDD6A
MVKPLVSVVMITYGHEEFIIEAINGVLLQQYDGAIELIIANDRSPDNTDEIIKSFLQKIEIPKNIDVKYVLHEKNKGMLANFLWTIEQGRGKYIAICEGDDFWIDPLKIQKQVEVLEKNSEYNLCVHNTVVLKGNIEEKEDWRWDTKRQIFDLRDYIYRLFFHTSSALFRKMDNLPSYIFREGTMQADIALFLAVIDAKKVFFISEYMSTYRIHTGGITNSSLHKNQRKAYQSLLSIFEGFLTYSNSKYKREILFKMELIKRLIIVFDDKSNFLKRSKAKIEYYFYKIALRFATI